MYPSSSSSSRTSFPAPIATAAPPSVSPAVEEMWKGMDSFDTIFLRILDHIQSIYLALPRPLQIRIEKWCARLSEESVHDEWRKGRNAHATLLLRCVQTKEFIAPFDKLPPEGQLARLPSHVLLMLGAAERQLLPEATEKTKKPGGQQGFQNVRRQRQRDEFPKYKTRQINRWNHIVTNVFARPDSESDEKLVQRWQRRHSGCFGVVGPPLVAHNTVDDDAREESSSSRRDGMDTTGSGEMQGGIDADIHPETTTGKEMYSQYASRPLAIGRRNDYEDEKTELLKETQNDDDNTTTGVGGGGSGGHNIPLLPVRSSAATNAFAAAVAMKNGTFSKTGTKNNGIVHNVPNLYKTGAAAPMHQGVRPRIVVEDSRKQNDTRGRQATKSSSSLSSSSNDNNIPTWKRDDSLSSSIASSIRSRHERDLSFLRSGGDYDDEDNKTTTTTTSTCGRRSVSSSRSRVHFAPPAVAVAASLPVTTTTAAAAAATTSSPLERALMEAQAKADLLQKEHEMAMKQLAESRALLRRATAAKGEAENKAKVTASQVQQLQGQIQALGSHVANLTVQIQTASTETSAAHAVALKQKEEELAVLRRAHDAAITELQFVRDSGVAAAAAATDATRRLARMSKHRQSLSREEDNKVKVLLAYEFGRQGHSSKHKLKTVSKRKSVNVNENGKKGDKEKNEDEGDDDESVLVGTKSTSSSSAPISPLSFLPPTPPSIVYVNKYDSSSESHEEEDARGGEGGGNGGGTRKTVKTRVGSTNNRSSSSNKDNHHNHVQGLPWWPSIPSTTASLNQRKYVSGGEMKEVITPSFLHGRNAATTATTATTCSNAAVNIATSTESEMGTRTTTKIAETMKPTATFSQLDSSSLQQKVHVVPPSVSSSSTSSGGLPLRPAVSRILSAKKPNATTTKHVIIKAVDALPSSSATNPPSSSSRRSVFHASSSSNSGNNGSNASAAISSAFPTVGISSTPWPFPIASSSTDQQLQQQHKKQQSDLSTFSVLSSSSSATSSITTTTTTSDVGWMGQLAAATSASPSRSSSGKNNTAGNSSGSRSNNNNAQGYEANPDWNEPIVELDATARFVVVFKKG